MPPAKSQKQHALMGAVCSGSLKKSGLSASEACEYIKGQKKKGLPKRVKRKK